MDYKPQILVTQPNWANLQPELFDLVLQKLSFADRFVSRGVCKSWRSIAKNHILYVFIKNSQSQPPCLMLKSSDQTLSVFNLQGRSWQKVKDLPRKFNYCLGSSNGFLIFQDENSYLHLFNPFLDVGIKTFPLGRISTKKVILQSNPIINDNNDYAIVVIYVRDDCSSGIAYAKPGDGMWTNLEESRNEIYCDVICFDHLVYALSASFMVEAWDFTKPFPLKILIIAPQFPPEIFAYQKYPAYLYYLHCYLVESQGEFFLVKRYIAYHVRADGVVVDHMAARNGNEQCHYMTKCFKVFRLNFYKLNWVEVKDLGDRIIFLGRNQSIMVQSVDSKEYEKNSVYYTDDSCSPEYSNNYYDGHDTGFYRLQDGSIEWICVSSHILPPPLWVIPRSG